MLFDSTLRRELARNFGATLVVILTIVLTMMLIRTIGQAALGQVAPHDVALLLGYVALGHLSTMLALSLFIAVVATMTRMYRDSEMSIWFASGVGLTRFVRPVLRVSWPILLVIALLALFVWPWQNQRSAELKERYERRSDLSRVAPGQFQTSSDGTKTFFIERDAADKAIGRNVFILASQADSESVTSARSGKVEVAGDDPLSSSWRAASATSRTSRQARRRWRASRPSSRWWASAFSRAWTTCRQKRATTFDLLTDPTPRHQGELCCGGSACCWARRT